MSDSVEDGYAGTEEGGDYCWVDEGGDPHGGFGAEEAVLGVCGWWGRWVNVEDLGSLGIGVGLSGGFRGGGGTWEGGKKHTSSISGDAVNVCLFTHLKKPSLAEIARL